MDETDRTLVSAERERTLRTAIRALKTNPAYLILFCLGLMGGPIVAGAYFNQAPQVVMVATVAWSVFLIASILVVAYVETHPVGRSGTEPSPFDPPDDHARTHFLDGDSAENLDGTWDASWYLGHGEERRRYEFAPRDMATFEPTGGPAVFVRCMDPEHGEYWCFGRLSTDGYLPMIYWSQPGLNALTGVLLLKWDRSYRGRGRRLVGRWMGRSRDDTGSIVSGDVELVKKPA